MKKILITVALMCAAGMAHAGPMLGDYSSGGPVSFTQPLAQSNQFQVEEIVQRQGPLMLLKIRDLKANVEFTYWATEEQLEQGPDGQTVFLKSDVNPAGA